MTSALHAASAGRLRARVPLSIKPAVLAQHPPAIMGWRSAFVVVRTDADLRGALETVKAHNAHDGVDCGEPLIQLALVHVPRLKVSRAAKYGEDATIRVLVFGNGGGMWASDGTWPWFARTGFKMFSWEKFTSERLRRKLADAMQPIEDVDAELARLDGTTTGTGGCENL